MRRETAPTTAVSIWLPVSAVEHRGGGGGRGAVIPAHPIVLHSQAPLLLGLNLLQVVLQPVVCHVLLLGDQGRLGAAGNGRCAGAVRRRQAVESCLGAAQAADGAVVLLLHGQERKPSLRGLDVAVLVRGGFPLARCRWEAVSGEDGPERTDGAVGVTAVV